MLVKMVILFVRAISSNGLVLRVKLKLQFVRSMDLLWDVKNETLRSAPMGYQEKNLGKRFFLNDFN